MSAQGTTTLDFGAFPGGSQAKTDVTGQSGILAGSLVEAWLYPVATADHTVGEQILDSGNLIVTATDIVAGTGFTIYGQLDTNTPNFYGLYNVAWVWN